MGANHVRVLSQMRDVSLVGVADVDRAALRKIHEEYDVPVYPSAEELLDQRLDAVTIAVPTSMHRAMALSAIDRKIHVLVEKPIARELGEAEEVIKAAEENGVSLMIGHIERFNPIIPTIREALSGEKIISVDITRVGPFPPRVKDVGVIVDLGVHDIDLIRFLTASEFADINCYTSSNFPRFEDAAMLSFRMSNGVVAHVTTNWVTPFKSRKIQIATQTKFIEGDLLAMQVSEFSRFEQNNGSYSVNVLKTKMGEPLRFEMEAFVESIRTNTIPPITGEDGFQALSVAIKCLEANGRSYR